jgi:hypothetical protein
MTETCNLTVTGNLPVSEKILPSNGGMAGADVRLCPTGAGLRPTCRDALARDVQILER